MRPRLRPGDVLEREPNLQLASLPGGRLLLRHPGGVSVIDGVQRKEAEAVLAEVDGKRTAEEVVDALADRYETRTAVRVLRRLFGDALRRVPPSAPGRVLVLGNGRAADEVAGELERQGLEAELLDDPNALGSRLGTVDLVVAALEETPYRTLFGVQAACLDAGVPSLFVTFDADGVRLGPSTLPGKTACFACSQTASFRFLREEDLFGAVEEIRTLGWTPGVREPLRRAAVEARRLLGPGGEPSLLTRVVRFSPAGRTSYSVVPGESCPLHCGRAASDEAGASRAAAERIEVDERRPLAAGPGNEETVRSVGVLGGGTAGYLAALALRRKLPHLEVTLIESSAVPIIGVGEATTPLMPQFLHADLGIDVHELFRDVRPTFKLGIRFRWGPPDDADFSYPFGPVRALEAFVHDGHLRNCSLRSMMMTSDRLPLLEDGGRTFSRLDTEVAYHLDNAKFVRFLQREAEQAGVERVDATIADAEVSAGGEEIRALVSEDGRRFAFDLYVDCSGFRSLLMEKALGSPFLSFDRSLFTDRAWVATVPVQGVIRPYTLAETLRSGWCWSTPQAGEDHRGYVFCSSFASPDEALDEMRAANPGLGEARLVKFRAGRHEHFWQGNVVALGNAYGFVEPLESTALHMLIRQIGLLVQAFPLRRGGAGPGVLNRKVGGAWDYLCWFLAIHYKYNRLLATPFWRACREEVDVSAHGELLESFAERGPLSYDPAARRHFDYPDPLWGPEGIDVILLGQRVASRLPRPRSDREEWERRLELCRSVVRRSLRQERVLGLLADEPELLERMAAAFQAVGPAYLVGIH